MITSFEALGVMSTVDDAAALLLRTTQQEFPVLDGASRLRGVVTRQAIIDALKARGWRGDAGSGDDGDGRADGAAQHASRQRGRASAARTRRRVVGVVDTSGRFAGYITPENISELMMIRSSREERSAGWLRS